MDPRHLPSPFGGLDPIGLAASDPLTRRELEAVCRMLEHERPGTSASIMVLVEDRLRLAAGPNLSAAIARRFDGRVLEASGLSHHLDADAGSTVGYGRLAADARWPELAETATAAGFVCLTTAPIRGDQGGLLGLCMLHHAVAADPVDQDRHTAVHAAGVAGPILERACRRCQQELARDWVEQALDAASAGLWDWDVPTGRVRASRGLRTLLGVREDDGPLEFEHIVDAVDSGERSDFLALLNDQLLSPEGRIDVIARLRSADGSWRWIRSTGRVVARDIDDRPIRVIGQHLDETRRRELEERERRVAERLHRISDSAPVMLFQLAVHGDGTVELPFASHAVSAMTGIPLDRMRTDPRVLLDRVHPDDRAGLLASLDRCRERQADWRHEFRLRAADGGDRWVHGQAACRRGPGDGAVWHGYLDEITGRKRLEGRLIEASEAAAEASRLKSAFIMTLSHELRTPLTAILGFVDLLHDGSLGDDAAQIAEAFDTIRRNGQSLRGLIDEMLELSDVEESSGPARNDPVPVDPRQLLDQVIETHRSRAERKGLRLDVLHDSPVPSMIVTDPFRLQQAFDRLLDNAVRYTDTGRVRIRLSVSVDAPATGVPAVPRLSIVIEDTGRGMTEEQIEQVLGVPADDTGGLGLRVARSLMHALGAELRLESAVGRGSTVTILLGLDQAAGRSAGRSAGVVDPRAGQPRRTG